MKRILLSLAAVFMLLTTFMSCSEDDNNDNTFTPQTYKTWSKVVFGYGSMFDADETISVSESKVTFHSNTWGDGSFTVSELKLNRDGSYSVTGEGTLTMAGHGGTKDYAASITGNIAKDLQSFIITVPTVMGGTVLNISVGLIPDVAAIDGTYKGGTYANCKYFQHYQPTENEKVVVKANDALDAASLSYTSETWGTFTFESIDVTKNEDGSYTLSGEGNTLMPSMKGGTTEYAASFDGTIEEGTLVATFSVPAVMGGTTILFNASDFAEVLAGAQVENSSK
ncbi:MAG: calycin-like domain-containing protein [Bacteroidaceae bacterium]|nr:calycin-like domain-containing protein [Bacteroidaceae bacterium]